MHRSTLLAATALLAVQTEAATLVTDVVGWTATATAAETHQAVASKRFTALLFDGEGRVVATGDAASLAERAAALGEPVQQVSGDGRFLMPGIIDAHGHFTSLGFDALRLNITGLHSLGETLEAIRAHVTSDTGKGWITGGRWNHELWPASRFPTAADLEGITDRPIWLRRVDGHAAWANRAAIEAAGVTKDTPDPHGGQIIRDADGNPAGVFVDAAMRLIDAVVPEPSDDDVRRAILKSQDIMVSRGLTQVHDAGADAREIRLFRELAAAGELKVRLWVMLAGAPTLAQFAAPIDDPTDFVDVRALKLYADGALGSRGAALFEDYSDDEGNRGLLFI
jgi:predicted amidohydrolase YtcJ